jgi:hypothetical protein
MFPIKVLRSDGTVLEIQLLSLFNMLEQPESYLDVLSRINRGGRITVKLREGLVQVERHMPPAASQASLPLAQYVAHVALHFELPARIHCQANSAIEGRHLIEETILGSCGQSPGFSIEIDPGEVANLLANLDIGSLNVISAVDVINIQPQLRLGGQQT